MFALEQVPGYKAFVGYYQDKIGKHRHKQDIAVNFVAWSPHPDIITAASLELNIPEGTLQSYVGGPRKKLEANLALYYLLSYIFYCL
mgnify:FL=1